MSEISNQVSRVRHAVGTRAIEAGEARVSTISQVYDTDIEDLWDVVTSPERIARWFLPVSGDFRVGGNYQFEGNAGGTITACDRPHSYAATWEMGEMVSWIEVRLTTEGEGTRFELTHWGMVPDEMWSQFGPGATGIGWDGALLGLALHLSDSTAGPSKEELATWHETEEGRAFYRAAADAWEAAAVAAGEDPAQAKEAAERSFGFYTGTFG